MAAPVRMLDVCRSLNLAQVSSFSDEFDTAGALSAAWSPGNWTIQGTASAGAPTAGGGAVRTGAVELRDAYVDATAIANGAAATAVLRELIGRVSATGMPINTNVYLFMDLHDTTPNPTTAAITVKAEKNADGGRSLSLWVGALSGTALVKKSLTALQGDTGNVRVTIDAAKVIRVYWDSDSVPRIVYTASSYTPAGSRVGFAIQQEASVVPANLYAFDFRYTLAAAAVPPRTLVASAGGLLYRETTIGTMVQKSISPLTIEPTTRIWAQSHLQDLYVADYVAAVLSGAAGVTAPGGSFDDAAIADWTTPVTPGADVIVNGAFTGGGTGWTAGTGWSFAGDVAVATGAISTDLSQTIPPLVVGTTYRVVFTVAHTAGSITPVCGTKAGSAISSSTTSTQDIVCISTTGFKFTTIGFTGTVDVVSATALPYFIDLNNHVLEILDLADVGEPANVSGFYTITAKVAGNLTISPAPGTRSNLTWRVIRSVKKYSLPADALAVIGMGTVGISQFPHGCRSFRLWGNRIVACNNDLVPHGWWMSAVKHPNLWDYGDSGSVGANGLTTDSPLLTLGEAAATTDSQTEFAGQIGEPLVTTIPIRDDLLIFAGEDGFYYLRGNPRDGGRMNYIPGPKGVGLVGIGAWVYTPQGRLFGLTTDGLYEVKLDGVVPISRDVIPKELLGLSADRYEVELGYDSERRGFLISCYSATLPYIAYFYDMRAEGFFPEDRDPDHVPSAMVPHRIGDSGVSTLLLGGQDGYIRQYSDDAPYDDGRYFDSYVDYGPLRLGAGEMGDGILHEVLDVLDTDSGSVVNTVRRGHSAEAANAADSCCDMTSGAGRNRVKYPRIRAGVVYLRTTGSGVRWARESLTVTREKVGRLVVP